MPLEIEALNSAVRLTTAGDVRGTAFIVSVESEAIPGKWWPYVLTADHNIRNQLEIAIEVPDPHPDAAGKHSDPIPLDESEWHQPLTRIDLAVARYPNDPARRFQAIRINQMFPQGKTPQLGAIIYYVGIFVPLLGGVPMARAGNLGALNVPIKKTYNTHTYQYNGHLVDCRSYGGFSGSPCFIQTLYGTLDGPVDPSVWVPPLPGGNPPTLRSLVWTAPLVGLFTAHISDEGTASNPENAISRYGVGVMLSGDYIWEALMTDEAKQERQEWDEQCLAARAAAQPPLRDVSVQPSDSPNQEFERFEALTRKLVQTPKPSAAGTSGVVDEP